MIDKRRSLLVDLDGTLAMPTRGPGFEIGPPSPAIKRRVLDQIKAGRDVVVFTARATDGSQIPVVKNWLADNGFPDLRITNVKDMTAGEIWDDKAVGIDPATGDLSGAEPMKEDGMRDEGKVNVEVALMFGRGPEGVYPPEDSPCGCDQCKRSSHTGVIHAPFADTIVQRRRQREAHQNLKDLEKAESGKAVEPVSDAKFVKYVAKPDARPEHKALHGKVIPSDSVAALSVRPPADKNCRCKVKPVERPAGKPMTKPKDDYYHQGFADLKVKGKKGDVTFPDISKEETYDSLNNRIKDLSNKEKIKELTTFLANTRHLKNKYTTNLKMLQQTEVKPESLKPVNDNLTRLTSGVDMAEKALKSLGVEVKSETKKEDDLRKTALTMESRARSAITLMAKNITQDTKTLGDKVYELLTKAEEETDPVKRADAFRKVFAAATDVVSNSKIDQSRKTQEFQERMKTAKTDKDVERLKGVYDSMSVGARAELLLNKPELSSVLGETASSLISDMPGLREHQKELISAKFNEKGAPKENARKVSDLLNTMLRDNERLDDALASSGVDPKTVSDRAYRVMGANSSVSDEKDKSIVEQAKAYARRVEAEKAKSQSAAAEAKERFGVDVPEETLAKSEKAGIDVAYNKDNLLAKAAALEAEADKMRKGKIPGTKPALAAYKANIQDYLDKAKALRSRAAAMTTPSSSEKAYRMGTAASRSLDVKRLVDEFGFSTPSAEKAYSLGYTKRPEGFESGAVLYKADFPKEFTTVKAEEKTAEPGKPEAQAPSAAVEETKSPTKSSLEVIKEGHNLLKRARDLGWKDEKNAIENADIGWDDFTASVESARKFIELKQVEESIPPILPTSKQEALDAEWARANPEPPAAPLPAPVSESGRTNAARERAKPIAAEAKRLGSTDERMNPAWIDSLDRTEGEINGMVVDAEGFIELKNKEANTNQGGN